MSDATDEGKETARKAAEEAIPAILEVYNAFFLADGPFIGGDEPSIADIRLACTLEFLAVSDVELPGWVKDYMERVESTLGDAYSEPAGDVRGYIAQVTGEAVTS
jgi:glutathione S-transferase